MKRSEPFLAETNTGRDWRKWPDRGRRLEFLNQGLPGNCQTRGVETSSRALRGLTLFVVVANRPLQSLPQDTSSAKGLSRALARTLRQGSTGLWPPAAPSLAT